MTIQEKLNEQLQLRGWSAYTLAKRSGLAEMTVYHILKRNTSPSLPTLMALCKGLGMTVGELLEEETEEEMWLAQKISCLNDERKAMVKALVELFCRDR